MMLSGIIGFQSVLLLFLLAVCVAIRQKLRNGGGAEKEEEIARLVAMASEETAMAEVVEYRSVPVSVSRPYSCAVCYSPTTTRCSKCKSVRYCSGKCQILHWRQGHKDECHPPTVAMQFGDESDSSIQTTLTMGDDGKPHSNTSSLHRSELSPDDNFGTSANANDSHQSKPPSSDSTNLANGSSRGNKLSKTSSSYSIPKVSFAVEFNKGNNVTPNDVQLTESGDRNPTRKTHASKIRSSRSDDREKDPQQREPDRNRPSSHGASHSRSSSTTRGHTKSSFSSVKVDDCQAMPTRIDSTHASSSSTRGQIVLGSNSPKVDSCPDLPRKTDSTLVLPRITRDTLKTSVSKVVQQFRASKQVKPRQLGLGNEIANCKIVFPYEVFVKLYCHDNVELHPFGLINCGNSCYANAVLQCLSFTRPLTSYLLQGLHSKACRKKGWCFICEFECLLLQAREGKSPLSPIRILSKIEKIGRHLGQGTEEDAHEFLRYAVDTMQSSCLKEAGIVGSVAEETTLIGLTFGGYLQSKIKCRKCLGKSERHEQMMDLTVEIDGEINTLEEALRQFTATEFLDGVNKYYCNRCKSYEKAKKKLTISEAPNILTIVLKRFQSDNFEKLNKSIRYPEVLDMAPYLSGTSDDKSPMYSLYAVIVHLDIMNATVSGHYVCYVKNLHGEWFKIDDSMVIPVESDRALMQGAYMLLYSRHSPRPRTPYLVSNNVVTQDNKPKKRNSEAIPSDNRPNPRVSSTDRPNPPFYQNDWRFQSVHRIPRVDSSSDNSSLFSSSDASSCATTSTKDSEDFSDYLFGQHYNVPSNLDGSLSHRHSSGDAEYAWSSW